MGPSHTPLHHLISTYKRYKRKLTRVGDDLTKRNFLIKRLERLREELLSLMNVAKLAGAGALVMGMLNAGTASAQVATFIPPVYNPYGLTVQGYYANVSEFADLDGDGDLDILSYQYYGQPYLYENTGTNMAPAFAAPTTNPFNLPNTNEYIASPALVDIDGDGDLDLFVGTYYGGNILFYEDTSTVTNVKNYGAQQTAPFGITLPAVAYLYAASMDFADMDDDGDYDMVYGVSYAYGNRLYYYENTGTNLAPAFAAPVTFGFGINFNSRYTYNNIPVLQDMDGDTDFDLVLSIDNGSYHYFENSGTITNPVFSNLVANPMRLAEGLASWMPVDFMDINADGILDACITGYDGFHFQLGNPIVQLNPIPQVLSVCEGSTEAITLDFDHLLAGTINIVGQSSNQAIVDDNDIVITNSGNNFNISFTVSSTAAGLKDTLTFTVSDGTVAYDISAKVFVQEAAQPVAPFTGCITSPLALTYPTPVGWFASDTSSAPLNIGTSFNTPPLSGGRFYYIAPADSGVAVTGVNANAYAVVEHGAITGDDRGGIAVTPTDVYVMGDDSTARYGSDLTGSGYAYENTDGLFSDLSTGTLYSLYNISSGTYPIGQYVSDFDVTGLAELSSNLIPTGTIIPLSQTVTMGGEYGDDDQAGIYPGHGALIVYSGNVDSSFYKIDIATGNVTNLGNGGIYDRETNENWAQWGFSAETKAGDFIYYMGSSPSNELRKMNMQTGMVQTVALLPDVSDMASIAYDPWNHRLYGHFEYSTIDISGSGAENLVYFEVSDAAGDFFSTCRTPVEVVIAPEVVVTDTVMHETGNASNGSISLTGITGGTAPFAFAWNTGDTTQNLIGLAAGTYTVTITDDNGCETTETYVVSNFVGMANVGGSLDVKVYPNPASGKVQVELFGTIAEGCTVEVYDLIGKLHLSERMNGRHSVSLDVTGMAKGIYYIRIEGGNAVSVKKLMVE